MKRPPISRRDFGKALGLAGAASAIPGVEALTPAAQTTTAPPPPASAPARGPDVYLFFTPAESAFVEAAIARLVPADELGPGAREAGVALFIDRQLAGAYGSAAKWYMRGPWGESSPQQGYQLPLAPRELYRLAIAQIDAHVRQQHGRRFDQLAPADQDALLTDLDRGALKIADVPAKAFFELLLGNTIEGFFADPIHGGNRDKAGWRLVGFPGVAGSYINWIGRHNQPYRVEPVSIADVLERRVRQDEHGHVIHEPLDAGPAGPMNPGPERPGTTGSR